MKKAAQRIFVLLIAVFVFASEFAVASLAGSVTFDGNSKEFLFSPGSDSSPTDLFEEFKNVMPGDSLTQKITVKNDSSDKVKVKVYMRSLGAKEGSEEFLSKLKLTVSPSADNEMAYMFDAADGVSGLSEWVLLGTLYSGGEVDLDVTLSVPIELGNEFSDATGYLDWQFKVEEFPAEDTDPKPPQTGEDPRVYGHFILMTVSGMIVIALLSYSIVKKTVKK